MCQSKPGPRCRSHVEAKVDDSYGQYVESGYSPEAYTSMRTHTMEYVARLTDDDAEKMADDSNTGAEWMSTVRKHEKEILNYHKNQAKAFKTKNPDADLATRKVFAAKIEKKAEKARREYHAHIAENDKTGQIAVNGIDDRVESIARTVSTRRTQEKLDRAEGKTKENSNVRTLRPAPAPEPAPDNVIHLDAPSALLGRFRKRAAEQGYSPSKVA